MLEIIGFVAPYATAVIGLLGGVYAAIKSNSNQLTAAYFNRMTSAYETLWQCFTTFVYTPSDEHRNQFSAAVYNAVLYASDDSAKAIQVLFDKTIEYLRSGKQDMQQLDEWAGVLEEQLHEEVATFRHRVRR